MVKREELFQLTRMLLKKIINEIYKKKIIEKYLNNEKLIKTIYVKNRIINYLIK